MEWKIKRHYLRSGKARIVDLEPSCSTASYPHTALMSKQNKDLWKDEQRVSRLVELCMEEFRNNRVREGKLGVTNYEHIADIMKVDIPCLDASKIKTKVDNFRKEYVAFNELKKKTGFGWNEIDKTVVADVAQWTEVLSKDKTLVRFMGKGLVHYDELAYMFAGSTSNGLMHRANAQGPSSEREERHLNEGERVRSVTIDLTEGDTPLPYTPATGSRKRPSPVPSGSGQRKTQTREGDPMKESWEEVSQNYLRAKADRISSSFTSRTSLIDDCVDALYAIDPPPDDDAIVKALERISTSATFRQTFLRVPVDKRRTGLSR
ncbi:hypothetical protein CJ030_MR5G009618 [Morella rubra]|uniref:Myb/SANT-like domain-containing protein n=1 Tax=Morella rubra TaxID=262757 RepID=A0A6A1VMW7_9ROSI|nr:hypothetical protein CJ030_MR5G009618 [Morella rubra]